MKLRERQKDILLKIVKDYVALVRPISSKFLKDKYKLPFSSATIRSEMQKLTQEGFLFQPHTSAGRIPTDRGYRIFVDEILKEGPKDIKLKDYSKEKFEDEFCFLRSLLRDLSKLSNVFISVYVEKKKWYFEEGWKEVLKEPEFFQRDCLFEFTLFVKKIEKAIQRLELNSEIKVWIGREIPFKEGEKFSLISCKTSLPEFGKMIISFSGPQRMDYNKNISILKSLKEQLNNL
jgi:transcriptional regulator of heat shock response